MERKENKSIVYQVIDKNDKSILYFLTVNDANEWFLSPFCNFEKSYIKKIYTNNINILNQAKKLSKLVNKSDWYQYA
jgi:hypothetical protein